MKLLDALASSRVYTNGLMWIVVEPRAHSHLVRVGVGATVGEALCGMRATPVPTHRGTTAAAAALQWAAAAHGLGAHAQLREVQLHEVMVARAPDRATRPGITIECARSFHDRNTRRWLVVSMAERGSCMGLGLSSRSMDDAHLAIAPTPIAATGTGHSMWATLDWAHRAHGTSPAAALHEVVFPGDG